MWIIVLVLFIAAFAIIISNIAVVQQSEAALCRKRELYPEWRIYYAAVPLEDKQEREQTIACMLRYLKAEGEGH